MSNESIPVALQSLLSELHFIAQFERDKKPCMSNMSFVSASSYSLGPVIRWQKGESRTTLISDIEKIVQKFINALTTYKNTDEYISLLVNLAATCSVSIETSLMNVYRNDPKMIGKIKVILTNIGLQLIKYPTLINNTNYNTNNNNNNINNNTDSDRI